MYRNVLNKKIKLQLILWNGKKTWTKLWTKIFKKFEKQVDLSFIVTLDLYMTKLAEATVVISSFLAPFFNPLTIIISL